ncbi:carboxylesterase [Mycena floridula]|nr:carboxylesterase [Mycena floridula]
MLFLSITLALSLVRECSSATPGLLVSTQQGPVQGSNPVPNVRQFLGIPYATAKRWQAPQAAPSHAATLQATKFGNSCPQAFTPGAVAFLELVGAANDTITESEACLSANVWAPSLTRKQNTAVMVWVYGGAFEFGTSDQPSYNGVNLVRDHDDITLVTFNYRLNVFGQPNAPQLANGTVSQNFGLLDINAAVDWVHKNIAKFGGDPERIIIFGESAGAVAVDSYAFQHPGDTIVKGIIQESGSVSGSASATDTSGPTIDPTSWNQLAGTLGCGTVANSAQFTCMQAVPSKTMEDALIKLNLSFNLAIDDITIFHDTRARATAGNFLKVPLLHGTNQHEMDVFVVADELIVNGFATPVITEVVADLETQIAFTCPAAVVSADRIQANVPVHRYQFQGVFPKLVGRADLRAFHSLEIGFVFNTIANPTAEITGLSKTVQGAWVVFARDPVGGLNALGWPEYSPATNSLIQLGNFANTTGFTLGSGALLDSSCLNITTLAVTAAQLSAVIGIDATLVL